MSIEVLSFLGPTFSKINAMVSDGRSRRVLLGTAISSCPFRSMSGESWVNSKDGLRLLFGFSNDLASLDSGWVRQPICLQSGGGRL